MIKGLPTTRDLIFFDLETTGVNVDEDRIVQIGALKYETKEAWSRHQEPSLTINMKLNPSMSIPKEASDVHGITNEDVANKKTFKQIAPKLFKVFDGCDVCGYNSKRFDIQLLKAEFERCGIHWEPVNQIDVFAIYNQLLPRTLAGALRTYCAEELTNAHDAMADLVATKEILWAQLARHPELHKKTPGEIEALVTDPDEVDIDGKLKRIDGVVCINFGKHKGTPITEVPRSYWSWCQKENVFTRETWSHIDGN